MVKFKFFDNQKNKFVSPPSYIWDKRHELKIQNKSVHDENLKKMFILTCSNKKL